VAMRSVGWSGGVELAIDGVVAAMSHPERGEENGAGSAGAGASNLQPAAGSAQPRHDHADHLAATMTSGGLDDG